MATQDCERLERLSIDYDDTLAVANLKGGIMVRHTRRKWCCDPEVLLLRSKSHLRLIPLLSCTTQAVSNKLTNPIFVSQDNWLRLKVNLSRWGTHGLTIHEIQDEAELVRSMEGICHTHDERTVLQRGRHQVRATRVLWSPAQWRFFLLFVTSKPL